MLDNGLGIPINEPHCILFDPKHYMNGHCFIVKWFKILDKNKWKQSERKEALLTIFDICFVSLWFESLIPEGIVTQRPGCMAVK